ncbi:hypothetical protein O9X80_07945 [Agrobacterium salinitolerans]|uniref:hypothetical protein n=1 Tax=Agrobacterium salinitolerans TaxID=1183413 RepID=UPI0022B82BC1|nr:hypothetical protein [Agrobacterium salinitolerans]MCZ7974420.1 hypothetical protein [Agrobacterium salinitolerans]
MTALEDIKKALEDVTPERVERLWWFLHILAKSTGTTNAEDDKWNWINAFCTDYEDDTFNLAAKLGFITVRHDSFMETSTARITKAGMALVAHFDKAPSAALTSTLEILQRENEEKSRDLSACQEQAVKDGNEISSLKAWQAGAISCREAEQARIDEYKRELERALCAHDLATREQTAAFFAAHARAEAADAEVKRLRSGIQWCLDRDKRNGSLPGSYAEKLQALASTGGEHNGN